MLGRFLSADTIVPGNASGGMDGVAVRPLTVSFVETPFLSTLNAENQLGHHFQLSGEQRQQRGSTWGPVQPQSLNRYSYVLNNPVKYTDPTGHAPGPGNKSVAGYHYRHVKGPVGASHRAGGYEYQVDPETGYYYRDTADGRYYLMETCIDGTGCKLADSSSANFGQFKAAVDGMQSSLVIAAGAGAATGLAGCAAGAALTSVSGPGAVVGCLLMAGVVGVATLAGTLVAALIYWSDEAKRGFGSIRSLAPPQRRRYR